jgi:L-2-hydroxyglutarate oxidase
MKTSDVVVVGGGLVGLATAMTLLQRRPGSGVTVLEKEAGVGRHQSTHNSGVLHCGLYYKPGSMKARMAVRGIRLMTEFCRAEGVPHEICGKLVVATNAVEEQRLAELEQRGQANGLQGVRRLGIEGLREIEPHAAGIAALRVPEEGIVDYAAVCRAMVARIEAAGGRVVTGAKVTGFVQEGAVRHRVLTTAGEFPSGLVINCAGLHCDRVARAAGLDPATRIVPFRGEYFKIRAERQFLVRHLIYPVPDPAFPFLGVHFTRLIGGGIEAGPNAVLAWAREGYRKTDVNPVDLAEALMFPGLWRFLGRHARMCAGEFLQSLSRDRFCKALQKLVPEIRPDDLEPGGAGVRAQAMTSSGQLVQDFDLLEVPGMLHVLNAPSPAATASLAIAEEILNRLGI